MNTPNQLAIWLHDAYAMERAIVRVLEAHANDVRDLPEIRARIEKHVSESRWHIEVVEQCLDILGEKPSITKSAMSQALGKVQSATTGLFRGQLISHFLTDYAAERWEIASYRSLIAGAYEFNQPDIARLCEEILRDEMEMAEWLTGHIPEITSESLPSVTTGK